MPYNNPDSTDPNLLIGVELPAGLETTREMAYVFAEELARMGFTKERLLKVFMTPFYAGPFKAFQELGEKEIEKIIDECVAIFGRLREVRK